MTTEEDREHEHKVWLDAFEQGIALAKSGVLMGHLDDSKLSEEGRALVRKEILHRLETFERLNQR